MKTKKIVLFGDSAFAEIAYEYFTHDSEYAVAAFTVSKNFLTKDKLFGLPVVPFEEITEHFPPSEYEMHIALVYNNLNRVRKKFYDEAKSLGYNLASYISSKAFVWRNVIHGENCFIFEDNTIQPFVVLGDNNVLWSGNHIGHHSHMGSHNFISSHVVVSGFCNIGNSNFFGVNATIANNLTIEDDCLIGSFAHLVKDVKSGSIIKGSINKAEPMLTYEKFNLHND